MLFFYDFLDFDGYEGVYLFYDCGIGMIVIIVIYLIMFGLVVGGMWFWYYVDSNDVVIDVLCLLCGMSYKNVMVGLFVGGGKVVIFVDVDWIKMLDMFVVFVCVVDSFGGCYIIV